MHFKLGCIWGGVYRSSIFLITSLISFVLMGKKWAMTKMTVMCLVCFLSMPLLCGATGFTGPFEADTLASTPGTPTPSASFGFEELPMSPPPPPIDHVFEPPPWYQEFMHELIHLTLITVFVVLYYLYLKKKAQ